MVCYNHNETAVLNISPILDYEPKFIMRKVRFEQDLHAFIFNYDHNQYSVLNPPSSLSTKNKPTANVSKVIFHLFAKSLFDTVRNHAKSIIIIHVCRSQF